MDLLQILQAQQRGAIDVAAREVACRLEVVGVVGHVPAQHRHHLEQALAGAIARIGLGCGAAPG